MLFLVAPPGHEHYEQDIAGLLAAPPSQEAALREAIATAAWRPAFLQHVPGISPVHRASLAAHPPPAMPGLPAHRVTCRPGGGAEPRPDQRGRLRQVKTRERTWVKRRRLPDSSLACSSPARRERCRRHLAKRNCGVR